VFGAATPSGSPWRLILTGIAIGPGACAGLAAGGRCDFRLSFSAWCVFSWPQRDTALIRQKNLPARKLGRAMSPVFTVVFAVAQDPQALFAAGCWGI